MSRGRQWRAGAGGGERGRRHGVAGCARSPPLHPPFPQVLPHTRYTDSEARTYASLAPHAETSLAARVAGGGTVEVTAAQFWSSPGEGGLELEVAFHGLEPSVPALALPPSGGAAKLLVCAPLRPERLRPVAKLDRLRFTLRPASADLRPLAAPRDAQARGRLAHALVLTYKFEAAEAGDYCVSMPLLSRYLYDNEFEAQMTMAFDANKKLLGVSDVYPDKLKLPKGAITFRTLVRHDDADLLRGLEGAALAVERIVDVAVPVYDTHADAQRGACMAAVKAAGGGGMKNGGKAAGGAGGAADPGTTNASADPQPQASGPSATTAPPSEAKERVLHVGERVALFVGPLADAALPKDAVPGTVLTGALVLGRKAARDGGGDAPGGVPLALAVPPPPAKQGKDKGGDDEDDDEAKPGAAEKRHTAVLDAEVAFLSGLKPKAEADAAESDALFADALARHGDHLPLLRARVAALAGLEGEPRTSRLDAIVAAADAVVAAVDTRELADAAARKSPDEAAGAKARAKKVADARAALVEALAAKSQALLDGAPARADTVPPRGSCALTATDIAALHTAFPQLQSHALQQVKVKN